MWVNPDWECGARNSFGLVLFYPLSCLKNQENKSVNFLVLVRFFYFKLKIKQIDIEATHKLCEVMGNYVSKDDRTTIPFSFFF